MVDRMAKMSSDYGLEINITKTKLLVVSKDTVTGSKLYINRFRIERVRQYKYLGMIINEKWVNSQEILCRIEKSRSVSVEYFQKEKFSVK